MKRLSIQLKVTLWFTLLMVGLGCMAMAVLLHAGGQTAQGEIQSLMMRMADTGSREMDGEDGQLEIDDDLEYFRDGVYLSVYDTAACRGTARCPASSTTPSRLPTARCAPPPAPTASTGMSMIRG